VHKDTAFSTHMYESCAVHGGDGFAFVLHYDEDTIDAVGDTGRGLGYAGIENSLAVEFDTWYVLEIRYFHLSLKSILLLYCIADL
jgi:hypothetical protein